MEVGYRSEVFGLKNKIPFNGKRAWLAQFQDQRSVEIRRALESLDAESRVRLPAGAICASGFGLPHQELQLIRAVELPAGRIVSIGNIQTVASALIHQDFADAMAYVSSPATAPIGVRLFVPYHSIELPESRVPFVVPRS